jgi:hypothetical protein
LVQTPWENRGAKAARMTTISGGRSTGVVSEVDGSCTTVDHRRRPLGLPVNFEWDGVGQLSALDKVECSREVGLQSGSPQRTTSDRAEGTGVGQTPVRRPGSDEDTPCRAGRAMVAQVAGQGFADIGRERETVVRAPLAPHLQHAGPPVDVLEFQGDHFAGPQSQSGQQENDGMITAGDGVIPLAGVDDPFDFFRREVLGDLGESPFRHSRDGPREVRLGLSVLEEEPEEGAQGRHHQPGDFGAARAGVSQEVARDVVRGQLRDTDRPIPEAFDDQTPDEGPVPCDRDRGEAAFLLEVVGILASKRRQRGLIDLRLW